jgi:hypothetical protein
VFLHQLVGVPVHEAPSLALQPERLPDPQFHNWYGLAVARITRRPFQTDQTGDIPAHSHTGIRRIPVIVML